MSLQSQLWDVAAAQRHGAAAPPQSSTWKGVAAVHAWLQTAMRPVATLL